MKSSDSLNYVVEQIHSVVVATITPTNFNVSSVQAHTKVGINIYSYLFL